MKGTIDTNNGKIIYPMAMLEQVVGGKEMVKSESDRYEFKKTDKWFHYRVGRILESLDEENVKYAIENLGYVMFT